MVTSVLSMNEAGRVMSAAQAVVYSAVLLTSGQRITGVSDLAKNYIVTFLIPHGLWSKLPSFSSYLNAPQATASLKVSDKFVHMQN